MCELVGELLVQMGNRFKKVNEREGEKLTFELVVGACLLTQQYQVKPVCVEE